MSPIIPHNPHLVGRLHNWKFGQAAQALRREPLVVKILVTRLAERYGDLGWPSDDVQQPDERLISAVVDLLLVGHPQGLFPRP